jgi:hypothetical protein
MTMFTSALTSAISQLTATAAGAACAGHFADSLHA